jgi:ribosomal protein S12 methylthiotransferase
VKIAEGCDYKCAFCIIPTLRGQYRSRPADSIVTEARALAARGVKELLLISQDTTFYGIDRGERGALARLLRELNTVDGLEWIRLLYLYPTTIDDDTLAAMADCDKVCKYIDLPLQHASDAVLKRMKRPGTRKTYDRCSRGSGPRPRRRPPHHLHRRFPGRNRGRSRGTLRFVSDHAFDHVGVFTYSHEEGTSRVRAARRRPGATKRRGAAASCACRSGWFSAIAPHCRSARPNRHRRPVGRPRTRPQRPAGRPGARHRRRCLLTDCDPSSYRAGDFAEVEFVGARELRPLIARRPPRRAIIFDSKPG